MKIPQLDFMTTVVAVFELQGNIVKKFEPGKPGNRELIIGHLTGTSPIIITDLHCEKAQLLMQDMECRCTIKRLMGEPIHNFMNNVVTSFQGTHININQAGILAWAPKLLQDLMAADDRKMDFATICSNSNWVFVNGKSTFKLNFEPIITRHSRPSDMFFHDGHDGAGNRIQFWARSKFDKQMAISARVRKHVIVDDIQTTILNYVKKI